MDADSRTGGSGELGWIGPKMQHQVNHARKWQDPKWDVRKALAVRRLLLSNLNHVLFIISLLHSLLLYPLASSPP